MAEKICLYCIIIYMEGRKNRVSPEAILSKLSSREYMTAKDIADFLHVSEKTARTRIAEINTLIEDQGAQIISRPRYGFRLEISDRDKWNAYFSSHALSREASQGSSQERISYIALKLLTADDYIKTSDFADQLYVSPQIISETLKDCEALFEYHHLTLERKPYYGLRLIGSEFSKRNCIVSCFQHEFGTFFEEHEGESEPIPEIIDTLIDCLQSHHIHLTEISLQSAAAYVFLSIIRFGRGFQIVDTQRKAENTAGFEAARDIFNELGIRVTEPEINHLAIYIAAMRANMADDIHARAVITARIDGLTEKIFESIRHIYKVDFSNNFRLRIMLSQHLISLDVRLRYRIALTNNAYLDIQAGYPYAYSLASEAVAVLKREYNTEVPNSETDWLALIFATGIHDQKIRQKMNVLVVCQAGRASSQLLKYQIERNYSEYVGNVTFATLHEVKSLDLSDIDFILCTVSAALPVDIPVMMVDDISLFSKNSTIEAGLIRHRLSVIDRFFHPNMFFTDIRVTDKADILKQLCDRMSRNVKLPEGFYESVMEREALHSTDYSPYVAVPHPTKLITEEDIVAVAVLDKPVFWGRYEIQVLLCAFLSMNDEEPTQLFYEVTSHFITDRRMVDQLIKDPSYSTLIGILGTVRID